MGGDGLVGLGVPKQQMSEGGGAMYNSDRPKCLIIDEIDGAPEASIKVLLNFVNGTANQGKKGKKQKKTILKRPIICICNDPYVAALRQLRQQALVLKFPPTSVARLTSRSIFSNLDLIKLTFQHLTVIPFLHWPNIVSSRCS